MSVLTIALNILQSPWKLAGIVIGSFIVLEASKILRAIFWEPRSSPLRDLPGPKRGDSFLWGHLPSLMGKDPAPLFDEWFTKYGSVLQFRSMMNTRQVLVKDPKAVAYIINNAYEFKKPYGIRRNLAALVGNGVLSAEGETHKRQRKIMNPCFGPTQMRNLMPIFYEKATQLREVWMRQLADPPRGGVIDVQPWLTKAALDVIGLAGFNYHFDSLSSAGETEMIKAFNNLFKPVQKIPIFAFLQGRYRLLALIPNERVKIIQENRSKLHAISKQLVQEKKATVMSSQDDDEKALTNRDMLSVLIKSNMTDSEKSSDHMTDEEVMAQICTMILAGHETTSSSVTWALWELAKPQHSHILQKLHAEITSVTSDQPSMEELNGLTYLDAFVRENLRINAPADSADRVAGKDCVIPLSQPYTDEKGVLRHEFRMARGEAILIPIQTINVDTTIWGDDAAEFKPERWFNPESYRRASELPGAYSSQLTFWGGPRACIGYRMAVLEIKTFLFDIIRHFDIALPTPILEVYRVPNVVVRPMVKFPDGTTKTAMPLHLRPRAI